MYLFRLSSEYYYPVTEYVVTEQVSVRKYINSYF